MHRNIVRSLFLILPFVTAGATWAQVEVAEEAPPKILEPGPRWTGRWIVHVERDAMLHRSAMKDMGALRRARDQAGLGALAADYAAAMEALQLPVIDFAIAQGAAVVDTSWLANAVALDNVDPALVEALAARADVRLVQADAWAEAQLEVATNAAHHNSDAANLLIGPGGIAVDGTGVTVAIVDSGIDADHAGSGRPHAAFFPGGNPASTTGAGLGGSRILSAVNSSAFFLGQPAEDSFGHGTRIASIAAGAEFNALPDVDDSPAFAANLRSYKISDDGIGGGLASVISMNKAFQDLLLDTDVVVANMSYDGTHDALASPNPAIDSATLADVFVTLSAGNFGGDLSFAHACFNALVVGSAPVGSKEPLVLPGVVISAIGPLDDGRRYPQLLAVGEAVTCADMDNEAGSIDSFGTSASAALVAGTAVLVRQADPTLSQLEVKALLMNFSDEVTLGDPNAAGFGYLRSDLAVEAALAGDVVSETITPGFVKKHKKFYSQGDAITLTATWNRESSTELTIDDLDLRVRDPQGNLIAWSGSAVDNIEQIRITAPTSGVYQVEVLAILFDGDGTADYALAGVDTQSVDPSNCLPGLPTILEQSPAAVPTLTNAAGVPPADPVNIVTLTGCNFTGANLVQVGTKFLPATVVDDNTLFFDIGIADAIGNVPISIFAASGTGTGTLFVVPADNVLSTSPTIDVGMLHVDIGGTPNDLYAIAFSPDLIPTAIPGLFSVDIGNGGLSLFPALSGSLNPTNGVEEFFFTGISAPSGQAIHFQGITIDFASLALPATSTNVSSALVFP